jgi:hypothetical protein
MESIAYQQLAEGTLLQKTAQNALKIEDQERE